LIVALAEFEKLPPPDEAAQQRLAVDGFGESPKFETWLAWWEDRPDPVAYAIFFQTYSTFEARPTLFLEDLFVLPECRGQGIGSAMLDHCVRLAHERGCGRMEWNCLDWNTRAQTVYDNLGAEQLSQWRLNRLSRERLAELAARPAVEMRGGTAG
jgi:GNAT superfamily N-acetyltransferase